MKRNGFPVKKPGICSSPFLFKKGDFIRLNEEILLLLTQVSGILFLSIHQEGTTMFCIHC